MLFLGKLLENGKSAPHSLRMARQCYWDRDFIFCSTFFGRRVLVGTAGGLSDSAPRFRRAWPVRTLSARQASRVSGKVIRACFFLACCRPRLTRRRPRRWTRSWRAPTVHTPPPQFPLSRPVPVPNLEHLSTRIRVAWHLVQASIWPDLRQSSRSRVRRKSAAGPSGIACCMWRVCLDCI